MDLEPGRRALPRRDSDRRLYHAGEHLWALARKLHPNDETHQKRWIMIHQPKLDEGQIEKRVSSLWCIDSSKAELAAKIRTEAEYFEKNAERLRYPEFRR